MWRWAGQGVRPDAWLVSGSEWLGLGESHVESPAFGEQVRPAPRPIWVMKAVLVACAALASPLAADSCTDVDREWHRLQDELRRQGYPVEHLRRPGRAAEGMRRFREQLERARWRAERGAGRRPVSGMQRVGGGAFDGAIRKAPPIGKLGATRRVGW